MERSRGATTGRPTWICSSSFALKSRSQRRDPAAARHQHVQRLQQLGRWQSLRLSRTRQSPRASRLVRPPALQACSGCGAPVRELGRARGYVLDYCSNDDLEFHPELLGHPASSFSAWGMTNTGRRRCGTMSKPSSARGTSRSSVATPAVGRSEVDGRRTRRTSLETGGTAKILSSRPAIIAPYRRSGATYLVKRPENQLTGVGFLRRRLSALAHGQFMDGAGNSPPIVPDHWVFKGTELASGEPFGGGTRSSVASATVANS